MKSMQSNKKVWYYSNHYQGKLKDFQDNDAKLG